MKVKLKRKELFELIVSGLLSEEVIFEAEPWFDKEKCCNIIPENTHLKACKYYSLLTPKLPEELTGQSLQGWGEVGEGFNSIIRYLKEMKDDR